MQQVVAQSGCRPPGVHIDSMQVRDGMQKAAKAQASYAALHAPCLAQVQQLAQSGGALQSTGAPVVSSLVVMSPVVPVEVAGLEVIGSEVIGVEVVSVIVDVVAAVVGSVPAVVPSPGVLGVVGATVVIGAVVVPSSSESPEHPSRHRNIVVMRRMARR